MTARAVDVLFELIVVLAAGLVLIPAAAAAGAQATDRSHLVRARAWVDRSLEGVDRFPGTGLESPAQRDAGLVTELVATDAFLARVLERAEPGYDGWSDTRRRAEAVRIRGQFSASPIGPHVVELELVSDDATLARRVLGAILDGYGEMLRDLRRGQLAAYRSSLDQQLADARAAMAVALASDSSYITAHPVESRNKKDPVLASLNAEAQAKVDAYLAIQQMADQVKSSAAAQELAGYRVVDSPREAPLQDVTRSRGLRFGLLALAATASLEALLVYLVAKRDPRVRTLNDLRGLTGAIVVGSAPAVGRP